MRVLARVRAYYTDIAYIGMAYVVMAYIVMSYAVESASSCAGILTRLV